jgi:putative FmdB family regulatory protein
VSAVPIYEFHCQQCDGDFEQLVRTTSGRPAVKCPECASRKVSRKLSLFGVSRLEALGDLELLFV